VSDSITTAFRFAKNNFDSIRCDSRQKIDSNRFVRFDSPTHMAVTQEVGGRRAAWLGAVYGVLPRKIWVPHCRVSCGNPSIGGLGDRRQQPVQSNRTFRFFLGNRVYSNRFAKWIESNRFESRIGMLYPLLRFVVDLSYSLLSQQMHSKLHATISKSYSKSHNLLYNRSTANRSNGVRH